MRRRWLWIALPALAALVVVENFLFFAGSSDRLREVPDDADEALELALEAGAAQEPLEPLEESDLLQWLAGIPLGRNPFWRAAEARAGTLDGSGLRLAGTLVGSTRKVAWIGGAPLSVGDTVADQVIVEIRPEGVLLERDGDPVFLEIASPESVEGPEENGDDALD